MKTLPLVFVLSATAGMAASSLRVLPHSAELRGREAVHRLIAQADLGSHEEDWTHQAAWSSSNPAVATVDSAGVVTPHGDGHAVITAQAKSLTATAAVTVTGTAAPFTWSFRNDVIPVLTKAGCNQGACHGALAGKNGFKLTLRGYDPEVDYDTLTRQSLGRRVSLADPTQSLILLKGSLAIGHGGGKRLPPASLEYRVLAEWIAAGAPAPVDQEPAVTSLEVFPAQARLRPNARQRLIVRAHYSDGNIRDVTHWVKYGSSDEGVASVDESGLVQMSGRGEAAITLWYANKVLYSRLTVPFDHRVDPAVYSRFPKRNFIDELAQRKWQALNLAPSAQTSDSTFLRRAYLDAAGILPTAEEVEEFLADPSPDKRRRLIDALVAREEFVDYWAYKWSDLFLVSSRRLRSNAMWSFYYWIRDSVKANKPWDRMARELFTAQGDTRTNGALNFFVLHKDPVQLSETVTQAFLGQKLTCARCHNHPLEKWTQRQYYQFANLFSRIGMKNSAEAGEMIVYAKTTGNLNHPRLLRPLPPAPLDGAELDLDSPEDRRAAFARWLTDPANPYFARAIVNRVWGNFMGRGFTEPVDDVRATNPASNEELFAALADDFVKHGYDLRRLVTLIMNSATYQLASEANATNQTDLKYYSRYLVKRLPAEVLLDAMSQVTGVPTRFGGYPAGTRALQLPDTQVQSQFLASFGRPARVICDAGERSSEPSITQALHVINGDTLNKKLSDPSGYAALALRLGLSDARIVEHLFLSAFSRFPAPEERGRLVEALRQARPASGPPEALRDARRKALEDMMWALLTSKDFLFNY